MNEALLTGIIAFIVSLLLGPGLIRYLRRLKYGQNVRDDGPAAHRSKQGTPTMGGILIVVAFALPLMIFSWDHALVRYAVFVTLGYALIGLIDDAIIVVAKRSLGLRARHKLIAQIVVGTLPALLALAEWGPTLWIPFARVEWELPVWLFLLISMGTMVGAANAVNLTDGLDGLAAGATAIAASFYAIVCTWLGHPEMTVFAAGLAGACLGFAWFNVHPAQVFMGDTGSLALGAALGAMAVLTRTPFFLLIIGGLFVIETLSVMLQVVYFRLSGGRRILRMSPLHHHFELAGWPEPKVVTRFWLIGLLCGLVGLLAV